MTKIDFDPNWPDIEFDINWPKNDFSQINPKWHKIDFDPSWHKAKLKQFFRIVTVQMTHQEGIEMIFQ